MHVYHRRAKSSLGKAQERLLETERVLPANWNRELAAAYLDVSVRSLKNLEYTGDLTPIRIGRSVRYTKRILDEYVALLEGRRFSNRV